MMRAEIAGPFSGDGTRAQRGYKAQVLDDYPEITGYRDTTRHSGSEIIPDLNLIIVEITCSAETLALIEADPRYRIEWSEEL